MQLNLVGEENFSIGIIFWKIRSLFNADNRLLKLMNNDKYEEFIIKQKILINKKKNEREKEVPIFNLSVGYFRNNQVNESIKVLESLDVNKLSNSVKPIYYDNLLTYYIHIRNDEMVDKVFSEGELYLRELKKVSNVAYNFVVCNYYAYKRMWKESNELLSKIDYDKLNKTGKVSYDFLKVNIYIGTDELEEAEKILKKLSQKQLSPKDMCLLKNFKINLN